MLDLLVVKVAYGQRSKLPNRLVRWRLTVTTLPSLMFSCCVTAETSNLGMRYDATGCPNFSRWFLATWHQVRKFHPRSTSVERSSTWCFQHLSCFEKHRPRKGDSADSLSSSLEHFWASRLGSCAPMPSSKAASTGSSVTWLPGCNVGIRRNR